MFRKFKAKQIEREDLATYIFSCLFFLLVLKLFQMQIIKYRYYHQLSEKNRIRVLVVEPPRGIIYDRNLMPIVTNTPSFAVSILPFEFKPSEAILKGLKEVLGMRMDELLARLEMLERTRYEPVKIRRNVPFEIVAKLEESNLDYQGVICEAEPQRVYQYGSTAAHIVGYLGEVSVDDLQSPMDEYLRPGELVGKQGVERVFDRILRGQLGAKFLEVRATGEVIGQARERKNIEPVKGADIVLTIDIELQKFVEQFMEPIPRGVAIVMDPTNGEILALVSRPAFDPSLFATGISDSLWKRLNDPQLHPLFNRAVQGYYPPGSIMKIITAAACLDRGLVTPETHLEPCRGSIWYGDRYFKCWFPGGHGDINLLDAIATSCDVYFYQLGLKLGLNAWSDYAKKSGFGTPTGIELKPEGAGFVPDRSYFSAKYGQYGWGYGVVLNLAIGQGEILVTPIQVAQFFSALANGGTIYRPHILKAIVPPFGRARQIKPEIVGHLPFSAEAIKACIKGMSRVVNSRWGTGIEAHLDNIEVAGKTSTVQNPHGAPHGWFVSFAPANDPKLLVVLLAENWGSGSSIAYIAREIFDYYFFKRGQNLSRR